MVAEEENPKMLNAHQIVNRVKEHLWPQAPGKNDNFLSIHVKGFPDDFFQRSIEGEEKGKKTALSFFPRKSSDG